MPPKNKQTYPCTVPFCTTRESSGFFGLPREQDIRKAWFEKLRLDPKINTHRICPLHFHESQLGKGHTIKRPFKGEIPTQNLPVRKFVKFLLPNTQIMIHTYYITQLKD